MDTSALFTEFQYKNLHLRNRFAMAPMTRSFSPDGVPTDHVAAYYARRAAADVGLILSEGTVIDRPGSKNHPNIPDFYGEKALSEWKKVIDGVHAKGGKMGPQIWHVGDLTPPGAERDTTRAFEGPDSMSVQDIQKAISAFADAATQAKKLGFDCLELHGAHGYLIDQFFWDRTNHRTDDYGGKTLKERSRFAVEVLKAVRKAVGPDFTVIMRLSQWKQQDYSVKLATTEKEMEDWLLPLSEASADIFHCSTRRFWEPEFGGSDLNFAGWAKKITGQPTITVGSVGQPGDFIGSFSGKSSVKNDLSELVRRFKRGDFDLVAIGRALLSDFEWVKKIREGRTAELTDFSPKSLSTLY